MRFHRNYSILPKPTPQMVHWVKLAYNRMYWLLAGGLYSKRPGENPWMR